MKIHEKIEKYLKEAGTSEYMKEGAGDKELHRLFFDKFRNFDTPIDQAEGQEHDPDENDQAADVTLSAIEKLNLRIINNMALSGDTQEYNKLKVAMVKVASGQPLNSKYVAVIAPILKAVIGKPTAKLKIFLSQH